MPVAWRYRYREPAEGEDTIWSNWIVLPYDPTGSLASGCEIQPLFASPTGMGVTEGWQPIDTAPKDGTRILASCADAQAPRASITWWERKWLIQIVPDEFVSGDPRQWFPTHWMPLPNPPEARHG